MHIPTTNPSIGKGDENNDDLVLDLMTRVRLDLFSASFGTQTDHVGQTVLSSMS